MAGLRTRIEDLSALVDLAVPLAHAVRRHMQEAAETAAALTLPNRADADQLYAALRVDRGTQDAGRSIVRAEEAVRHLDRTVDMAGVGATRSLGQAGALADAVHERTRLAQLTLPAGTPVNRPHGPTR